MKEFLTLSPKGQITLPAAMRQALGLHGQAVLTAEAREGRIVLAPAMVVETETWSDEQVAGWEKADAFAPGEQDALRSALAQGAGRG